MKSLWTVKTEADRVQLWSLLWTSNSMANALSYVCVLWGSIQHECIKYDNNIWWWQLLCRHSQFRKSQQSKCIENKCCKFPRTPCESPTVQLMSNFQTMINYLHLEFIQKSKRNYYFPINQNQLSFIRGNKQTHQRLCMLHRLRGKSSNSQQISSAVSWRGDNINIYQI